MNRFFLLFLLMLAGCQPERYSVAISFRNSCAYPVRIYAFPYLNESSDKTETFIKEQNLEPGETALVFFSGNMSNSKESIQRVLADDYKLEISANGKTISLDKAQFLKVLKKSNYSREKGACIICTSRRFSGTISTPSLCPVAEENAENLQ